MNRLAVLIGIVALVIGLGAGWLASDRARRQAQDAELGRLQSQVTDLRAEHDRLDAELRKARLQFDTTEAALGREREVNARLQALLGEGRK
jgi:peptidoglycan hydrolase CwlO-like protein